MSLQQEIGTAYLGLAAIRNRREFQQTHTQRLYTRMAEIEENKTQLVKAVGLIDKTIETVSANGIGRIEQIVTGGLRLGLDDPKVGLRIERSEGARGASLDLVPYRGATAGKALDTFGGSLANITAFLLRVIMIRRFGLAKFLFVDESFNGVSAEYQPMVSAMLQSLCRDHGFTVFAITHQPILAAAADHVYRLIPNPEEDAPPTLVKLDGSEMEELQAWSERAAAGF